MTTPDSIEQLQRRVAALEVDHFALQERVRTIGDAVDRHASGLDELEEALIELSTMAEQHAGAMEAAVAQRQHQLGSEDAGAIGPEAVGPSATTVAPGATSTPVPDLDTLHGWVQARIAPLVRKTTTTGEGGGIRWCRRWWEHHDAVERFTAMFLAFQQLSAEESRLWWSVFLRDHVDPHLVVLTSPYGPFHACTPRRHSTVIEPLGHAELAVTSISGGIDEHAGIA